MTTQTYRRVDLSEFEGHTPGPLTHRGHGIYADTLVHGSGRNVLMHGGELTWHEVRANGRLFCAAPDMAAELADARKQIETLRDVLLRISWRTDLGRELSREVSATLSATATKGERT